MRASLPSIRIVTAVWAAIMLVAAIACASEEKVAPAAATVAPAPAAPVAPAAQPKPGITTRSWARKRQIRRLGVS